MGLFNRRRRYVKPIFVGSYGNDMTRGIYVFHLDFTNGEFLKKKFYKTPANPTSFFKKERYIYVTYQNKTGNHNSGGVSQYASMDLQFGLTANAFNKGKTYVCTFVNEDRSYAYAVDYYNGEVVVIAILKQKIVKYVQEIKHVGSGPHPKRQAEAHPAYINITPDLKRMFVCDLGTDEVVVYHIEEKGKLRRDEDNSFTLPAGSGPNKMVFSPDGHFAYVLNELSCTVSVYQYDENCHFTFIQEIDTYPKDQFQGENIATDIIVTEKGDYLFATNQGHDSIVAYRINQETGELELVEYAPTDENPKALLIIVDRWLVVAAQKGGTLESFEIKRGERQGILFETHFNYMVGEPVCMIEGRGF